MQIYHCSRTCRIKLFTLNFLFLIFLTWLASYNIIFETTDSVIYQEYYESIGIENDYETVFGFREAIESTALGAKGFEPAFNLLATISKLELNLSFNNFVFLLIFFSLAIKFFLFFRRENSFFRILAYLLTLYFVFECLTIRNALAISLLFLAFEYRENKIFSIFILIVACLTHYSIIIFSPLLFFYKKLENNELFNKNFKYLSISILILFFIFYIFLYSYGRLSFYLEGNPDNINIYGIPKFILIWCYFYYLYSNLKLMDKNSSMLFAIGSTTIAFATIIFYFSLFSIRVLDVGILSFYLIEDNSFRNRDLGRFIVFLYILQEVIVRTLPTAGIYEIQKLVHIFSI